MKSLRLKTFDRFRSKNKKLFLEGEKKINEEICIVNLMQVICKLKCAVSILVGDHTQLIHKIQELFLEESTLKFEGHKAPFMNKMKNFLDRNERVNIREQIMEHQIEGELKERYTIMLSGIKEQLATENAGAEAEKSSSSSGNQIKEAKKETFDFSEIEDDIESSQKSGLRA